MVLIWCYCTYSGQSVRQYLDCGENRGLKYLGRAAVLCPAPKRRRRTTTGPQWIYNESAEEHPNCTHCGDVAMDGDIYIFVRFATSRAQSVKSRATGLRVRFFKVTSARGLIVVGRSILRPRNA